MTCQINTTKFETRLKNTKHKISYDSCCYDEKYIKAKLKEFNGVIIKHFLWDEIPKENMHCACIACITIDFVMRMGKNYPQVYLEECNYKIKKIKMAEFINTELESGSQIESDTELEPKSSLESES